jgi:ATP adenylyltransferase
MDYLWSPWRYKYVSQAEPGAGCFFCQKSSETRDQANLVLCRGRLNFVLLNLFPYTNGHMMVAPYEHVSTLEDTPEETVLEMMQLVRLASRHLRTVYRPQGINIGMNIGECSGAGIAGHIHVHLLPRWIGDSSFMTTIGETRIVPEDLDVSYKRLWEAFRNK